MYLYDLVIRMSGCSKFTHPSFNCFVPIRVAVDLDSILQNHAQPGAIYLSKYTYWCIFLRDGTKPILAWGEHAKLHTDENIMYALSKCTFP